MESTNLMKNRVPAAVAFTAGSVTSTLLIFEPFITTIFNGAGLSTRALVGGIVITAVLMCLSVVLVNSSPVLPCLGIVLALTLLGFSLLRNHAVLRTIVSLLVLPVSWIGTVSLWVDLDDEIDKKTQQCVDENTDNLVGLLFVPITCTFDMVFEVLDALWYIPVILLASVALYVAAWMLARHRKNKMH